MNSAHPHVTTDSPKKATPRKAPKKKANRDPREPVRTCEVHEQLAKVAGKSLYSGFARGVVMLGLDAAEKLLELASSHATEGRA